MKELDCRRVSTAARRLRRPFFGDRRGGRGGRLALEYLNTGKVTLTKGVLAAVFIVMAIAMHRARTR